VVLLLAEQLDGTPCAAEEARISNYIMRNNLFSDGTGYWEYREITPRSFMQTLLAFCSHFSNFAGPDFRWSQGMNWEFNSLGCI